MADKATGGNQGIGRDVLLAHLREFAEEIDKTPSMAEMASDGPHSTSTYGSNFGSWNGAIEAAGLTPNNYTNLTDEELLAEIHRLADELGRTPRHEDMENDGKYAVKWYGNTFGSGPEALEAAGLEVNQYHTIPEEELVPALKQFAEGLDKSPTVTEMDADGPYNHKVYTRVFGSWTGALEAAGLSANYHPNTTKAELIEGLKELAKNLGRTPYYADMAESENHSAKVYTSTFRSWNDALRAAGLPVNRERTRPLGERAPPSRGPNWSKQRAKARERDDYTCRICGLSDEEHRLKHSQALEVHHIQPFRTFEPFDSLEDYERANALSNLRTVCLPDHNRWEGIPVFPE